MGDTLVCICFLRHQKGVGEGNCAFTINSSTLLVVNFDEWRISTLEKC